MKRLVAKIFYSFIDFLLRKKIIQEIIRRVVYKVELETKRQNWEHSVLSQSNFFSVDASVLNHSNRRDNILIGESAFIRGHLRVLKYGGKIVIGDYVYVGLGTQIWSGEEIVIGNNTLISDYVFISDTDSHEVDYQTRELSYKSMLRDGLIREKGSIQTKMILIEDNVWIGYGSIILKGVRIGRATIIGAGSVVTEDCESGSFYAGNPAKLVKRLYAK